MPNCGKADVSRMVGSLAAAPLQPGWSLTTLEYFDSVHAGGDIALARNIRIHGFNTNFRANINANLNSTIDFGSLIPSYTFKQRFLGAQANVAMLAAVGNVRTTLQGMIAGSLEPGENAQKSGLSARGIGATS
jgi:hypothetical protein